MDLLEVNVLRPKSFEVACDRKNIKTLEGSRRGADPPHCGKASDSLLLYSKIGYTVALALSPPTTEQVT